MGKVLAPILFLTLGIIVLILRIAGLVGENAFNVAFAVMLVLATAFGIRASVKDSDKSK